MPAERIALITGANQGMGKHVAAELAADGVTVYVGSRDLARGQAAAAEIGAGAVAVQLEVTDPVSIAAASRRIAEDAGRLDLLVNNAAIATTRTDLEGMAELRAFSRAATVPLEEIRAVWEVNAFAPLALYQAMLPLLRASSAARVINVTSALGSLSLASDPSFPFHAGYDPVYSASKTALNALTLAMMRDADDAGIRMNLVSPGFANTALVQFEGTETVASAAREILRVARLGPDGASGTFTTWEGADVPW